MASSVHQEIERKFDVGGDTPLPPLAHLPGVAEEARPVEHHLEAVYFDTPDLVLASARRTLRRRTGGDDEGWHLKSPLAGGDRKELRHPLGEAAEGVPQPLLDEVRVLVRDRPLAPVAVLNTRRVVHRLLGGGGEVLAEVADDTVTAKTLGGSQVSILSWREWEVELVDGERELLDAVAGRLLEGGAAPAQGPSKLARVLADRLPAPREDGQDGQASPSRKGPARAVVQAHLSAQVSELRKRDPQVRRDEHDAVHKMRVATRRLRSALQTFRPLLDREVTDPVRGELRWLAAVLGEARDAEVKRDRLVARVGEEPPELVVGPVARRLGADLGDTYRAAHGRVLEALDSERYFRLLDRLDALVADAPWTDLAARPARVVLPARVRSAWRRLRRDVTAADTAPTPAERDERLHDARKSAKRTRYAAEALAPVFAPPASDFARAVTGVQEVLGEHQDSVVTRDLLRGIGEEARAAGEDTFTYGRLHGLEQARAADTEARFAAAWEEASDKRLRRWLKS